MRTPLEFKEQSNKHGITYWKIHNCSMCGYECGFHIDGDSVGYDNGCHCTRKSLNISSREWEDVAEQYNMQSNSDVIREYDGFWKFDTVE